MTIPFSFIAGFTEKQELERFIDFFSLPDEAVKKIHSGNFNYLFTTPHDSLAETICLNNDRNTVMVLLQGNFYGVVNQSVLQKKINAPDFDALQMSAEINSLNGDFSGIILDNNKRRVTLFTDLLGFSKIFYSTANGSLIFSSSIWPLLRGNKQGIDRNALGEHLALGYPINHKTLFSGIHVLIPGELSTFDFNGNLLSETSFVQFRDLSSSLKMKDLKNEFFRQAEDHFTFFREKINPKKWGMTLTGGNDTRVLLNSFLHNKIQPLVYTGYAVSPEASRDCKRAKTIADKFSLSHKNIRYGADPLTKLIQVFLLSNGYLNGATISNLADQVDQDIDLMYYGFSGDLVSGGDEFNLKNLRLDEVIARSLNYKTYYKEHKIQTLLKLVDVPFETFYDEYSKSFTRYNQTGNIHYIYFLQEKNTRNYLRIASFADGSKTGPPRVYFFHDRRILDFYKSISDHLLKNQFLHHKLSYHKNIVLGLIPSANKSNLPSFVIPYLSKIMNEEQTARITKWHTRRRKPATIRFNDASDLFSFFFEGFRYDKLPEEISFERFISHLPSGEMLREDALTLKRRIWEVQMNYSASKNFNDFWNQLTNIR